MKKLDTVIKAFVAVVAIVFTFYCTADTYAQTKKEPKSIFVNLKTPGQYVDQINALFSQHRWNRGKEILDTALEKWPHDPTLHYLAGLYYWNAKDNEKARYHLVKSVSINYNQLDAKQLLVNLEDATGNYSSAICYINELLEVNPYWKGLWARKVDLYKKLGNYEEANILLRRLRQIYPNDASLTADHYELLESTYKTARQNNDLDAAEEALRDMVRIDPSETDYQLVYANLLIQRGKYNDAIEHLKGAINANPGNAALVKKAADLMMATGQNKGALALVREQMAIRPSGELSALYSNMMGVAAQMEEDAQPYELHTKVYGKDHSMESLQYLLKTSYQRNYYDDCITYIGEMRKRKGDSPALCMMEYETYLRSGHPDLANKALQNAAAKYPDNYDVNLAHSRMKMSEAADFMKEEAWSKAIPLLEDISQNCVDEDLKANAVRRLTTCYIQKNDFDNATRLLGQMLRYEPQHAVTIEYSDLLAKQGRKDDALQVLSQEYKTTSDENAKTLLRGAYEEKAIPYIKSLMQEGSYPQALGVCEGLLEIDPDNYWGLRYAVQASSDSDKYLAQAYQAYPKDVYFQQKQATQLSLNGSDQEALEMLKPLLKEHPGDTLLKGAYADVSERYALKLMKEKSYDRAAEVLDSALILNENNASLRMSRGLLHEKQRNYDSAYVYQSKYIPSLLEQKEYLEHMNVLRNKAYKNTAQVSYDYMRYSKDVYKTGVAMAGYSRSWLKKNTLAGRVYYTGRDGNDNKELDSLTSGGRGFKFEAEYTRELGAKWTGNAIAFVGNKYFPKFGASVDVTYHATDYWDYSGGLLFRTMSDKGQMFGGNLGAQYQKGHFMLGAKSTVGHFHSKLFVNGMLRARYYIYEGGKTFIEAQGGAGTAPELTFSDIYYTPSVYNHLNSFVSLAFNWLIVPGLSVDLSISWNTLYYNKEDVYYRNMLMGHVQFVVYF